MCLKMSCVVRDKVVCWLVDVAGGVHGWQNGTRCSDGVKVLSYFVHVPLSIVAYMTYLGNSRN